MTKEFKFEDLQEDLLLDLYKKFPNTIDDNARLLVEEIKYEKGKAHGCIYSGKAKITNQQKGIELEFDLWFDVYTMSYCAPEIVPTIETYLTGQYAKIEKLSEPIPTIGLEAVILLNIPKSSYFVSLKPQERRYFDAHWHVFETDEGHKVLSKEGWFGTYVYDAELGMRPTTDKDWINLKEGRKKLREGLELVKEAEYPKNPVKEFIMKKYNEKITPDMYVEL